MPLFIDDVPISKEVSFEHFFEEYPILKKQSEEYIANHITQKKYLEKRDRVLYVFQREFATMNPKQKNSSFKWISSDDATTCHIVVIIEEYTGSISLGHFDGCDTSNGLQKMMSSLVEIAKLSKTKDSDVSEIYNMYIFGGFNDSEKYSEKLFREIIKFTIQSKYRICLKLAPAWLLNSKPRGDKNIPIIFGVAVNIKTAEIVIAENKSPGPDIVLREARILLGENLKMINIYDFKDGLVCLKPFQYKISMYSTYLLRLPDEKFLEYMSTSPHCEPEHFVRRSKEAITFTLENPNPYEDVFNGSVRKYKLNKNNEWIVI